MGTNNVLDAAIHIGVKKVICLSTDKAVYPINAMGISKAMMEKVMVAKSRTVACNGTMVCGTRYGNVMASRGSVIPLFVQQIKANQPITVTNPDMTRFLMSLDESVDLVLYAFEHGRSGDIFVQKSPASTIGALAEAMMRVFEVDLAIKVIGTRHGEKLYETLLTREEMVQAEDLDRYFRVPADNRDLNYNKYFSDGKESLSYSDDYNSNNTTQLDVDQVVEKLLALDYIQEELQDWKVKA